MSEFLGIDINTLDDGGFQFYQTVLIRKVLEAAGMYHLNMLPTPTKVEAPLGTYVNGYEANRCWSNYCDCVIGMMLYIPSNTRPYISFSVHQCSRFTHNTKSSRETDVKRIHRYLQVTKENGLLFNPLNKMVVDCYADADFSGLWGHENPQENIYTGSRTGFLVTSFNCPLLWC